MFFKKSKLGIIVLSCFLLFSLGCENGTNSNGSNGNNGNNNNNGDSKTIVGTWTKSYEGSTGLLTFKPDNTWGMNVDGVDMNIVDATWDTNRIRFWYDYSGNPNPEFLTVPYSLSSDGNRLTFSGENASLLGGNTPWNRVN